MPEKVEWGSGPVRFEMYSDDAEIIREAQLVFSKWRPDASARLTGTWKVSRRNGEFVVDPRGQLEDGSDPAPATDAGYAVTIVEYLAVGTIVEKCDHVLAFHAALLAKGEKSIVIVGPSHAGKSTLATALWRKGWKFQCDDLTMSVGKKAIAAPRRVSLRRESREHVGEDLWQAVTGTRGYRETADGFLFQPMHVDDSSPGSFDLSAVFFLNRNGAARGKATRLSPVDGAFALLPYTNLSRTRKFPQAFKPVAALMSEVPGFDIPREPLPKMVERVESLVSSL